MMAQNGKGETLETHLCSLIIQHHNYQENSGIRLYYTECLEIGAPPPTA